MGDGGRPRRRLLVVALIACVIATGAAWALSAPLLAAADDDYHLASIWCSPTAPDDGCIEADETSRELPPHTALVPRPIAFESLCFIFQAHVSAACAPPESSPPQLTGGRANEGRYPTLYYVSMGFLARGGVSEAAIAMRLVTWFGTVGILVAAAAVARRDLRRAFTIGVLVTVVPMGISLLASNNPSGPALAGVSAYWCALTAYLQRDGDHRRRRLQLAVAAAAAIMALGSRYDSGMWLMVASASAVLGTQAWRGRSRLQLLGPAVGSVIGFVVALRSGRIGQALAGPGPRNDELLVTNLFQNVLELPTLVTGPLGTAWLGWHDTPVPSLTATTMVVVAAVAIGAGLTQRSRSKLLAVGVVGLAVTAAPLYTLAADRAAVGVGIQPRYLLPLLPMLVAAALLRPSDGEAVRLPANPARVAAWAVVVAHAAALHQVIRRYVTGTDVRGLDLGADLEWWWAVGPPPMAVWIVGSVAFGGLVFGALEVVGVLGPAAHAGEAPPPSARRTALRHVATRRRHRRGAPQPR